jgi:hypothetical protein
MPDELSGIGIFCDEPSTVWGALVQSSHTPPSSHSKVGVAADNGGRPGLGSVTTLTVAGQRRTSLALHYGWCGAGGTGFAFKPWYPDLRVPLLGQHIQL